MPKLDIDSCPRAGPNLEGDNSMRLRVNGAENPPASQNMGDPSLVSEKDDTDKVIIHIAEPNSQEIEAMP